MRITAPLKILLVLLSILLLLTCRSGATKLYPVLKDKVYGYINTKGKLVIYPQFLSANVFAQGWAPVVTIDNQASFTDKNGNLLNDLFPKTDKFDKVDVFTADGLARIVINGKVGFLNNKGNLLIPPMFERAGRFSEGLASAVNKNNKGYINKTGEFVIERDYQAYGDFHEGYAWFIKDGLYGVIDKEGRELIKPQWLFLGDFSSKLSKARELGSETYGFINIKGDWEIEAQFYDVGDFYDGLAWFYSPEKKLYGYIDSSGAIQIEADFIATGDFHNKIAWVQLGGKYAYINKQGKYITNPIFSTAHNFNSDLALAYSEEDEAVYINSRGNIVWPRNSWD